MPFSEFWKNDLSKEEAKAIQLLEQQVISLDKEWMKYEKKNFIDWNIKFQGLSLNQINPKMQIPMRDAKVEKTEFHMLWNETTELFRKTARLIEKGKSHDAIIILFNKIRTFEEMIDKIEIAEQETISFLRTHKNIFQNLFDNNYGKGYFENEVIGNYEIRFRILGILKNEYELIRYLLSDVV